MKKPPKPFLTWAFGDMMELEDMAGLDPVALRGVGVRVSLSLLSSTAFDKGYFFWWKHTFVYFNLELFNITTIKWLTTVKNVV